jgi:hypothetical protein
MLLFMSFSSITELTSTEHPNFSADYQSRTLRKEQLRALSV